MPSPTCTRRHNDGLNTEPPSHAAETYKKQNHAVPPVIQLCVLQLWALHLQPVCLTADHNPPHLLSVPSSFSPSFSLQQTNTRFSACRKGHLTVPSQCERYTVCIHFGTKHSQFHLASFFHTGSCTHRCALDEMKALSAWCSRAPLLPFFFLLSFTSSLLLSPTPWTSQVSLSLVYIFWLLPSLPLSLIQILSLSPLGRICKSLLLCLLSFYLLSLSSPAFTLTQAVSRGICHHRAHGAPMDDALKGRTGETTGERLDSDTNKPGFNKVQVLRVPSH